MKRIPLNALQAGLYQLVTEYAPVVGGRAVPIYDDIPKGVILPYISFGAFTCRDKAEKTVDVSDVSLQIEIFSDYQGRKEVNEIANDLIAIFGQLKPDLTADGFTIISQDSTMFESFTEADFEGYRGVISYDAKIQNMD